MIITHDFIFIWKPPNIPTSFWKNLSFLEKIKNKLKQFINLNWKKPNFKKEYWLLNRLDTPTSGLLYFARDEKIYELFKKLQNQNKIYKIYLADVHWDYRKYWKPLIAYPIMHHKFLKEKMIVIKNSKLKNKGRWKLHYVETEIEFLYYDPKLNISTLCIYIKKWIRHQIRSHLASVGYPIVGDQLYAKFTKKENLHLRSIGLKIKLV